MSAPQLFVTETSTSVVGLKVVLPQLCRCGETIAIAGSSRGSHYASASCACCGVHRGWLCAATYRFLSKVIDNFGRPNAPVEIHHNQSPPSGADNSQ